VNDMAPGPVHPFRAFWETGDLATWIDAMEPDVVLHSPMITTSFDGRQRAAELYGVLFEALDRFEVVEELSAGDSYACLWRATAAGRRIEGADFITSRPGGKVAEVRVLIRPLVNIGAFATEVGPALAAKRGRLQAAIVRASNLPLRIIFAVADAVVPRLVIRR
jgi:hypothetical protein